MSTGSLESESFAPLRGVHVLDASRYAPGPFCTLICSGLGADIWKLEEPRYGDPLRKLDSAAFEQLNFGKKSVTLNLKSAEGQSIARDLLKAMDVFVEGFRPGVSARLSLDHASVAPIVPRLVYVSITGYGQDGPLSDRAGHDVNYMALAGALAGASAPPPIQVADFAAGGLFSAISILAALLERERSGQGRYLDVSMHDGLLSFLRIATTSSGQKLSGRFPAYGIYEAKDGRRISVGALEPKFWERFCAAIGRPELSPRGFDASARAEIAGEIAKRDRAEWERVFSEVDACVEPVLEPVEALGHAHTAQRRMAGRLIGLPFARGETSDRSAPRLGEHTEEALSSLGISAHRIAELREKGVC